MSISRWNKPQVDDQDEGDWVDKAVELFPAAWSESAADAEFGGDGERQHEGHGADAKDGEGATERRRWSSKGEGDQVREGERGERESEVFALNGEVAAGHRR